MLRVNRRPRRVIARARAKLTATSEATTPTTPAAEPAAEPLDTETTPEPPRRVHMFGSQYRVRVPFEETMAARGYLGTAAIYRRSLADPRPGSASQRQQRDDALRRAGYQPGEVLWPSD